MTRYPAIFVDDVLVATPNDFGFYGRGEKEEGGRYAPLKSAAAHQRFRADLTRMINLVLAGRTDAARAQAAPAKSGEIAAFPAVTLQTLDGKRVTRAELVGKVVLVEFWATWCPPCRGTLGWLGEVKKRYGDRITVLAIAVESQEPDVRKLTKSLDLPLVWAMGSPEVARSFGDNSPVPTHFMFFTNGPTPRPVNGAPPQQHPISRPA